MLPIAILAGGLATRLRPMTESIPKSLIEINGTPFIHRQLRLLQQAGVNRVVLCTGYLSEMIEAEVGDGSAWSVEVSYSRDGGTQRGTGGAVKAAIPLLGDAFFVLYGDSYLEIDYAEVERRFVASSRDGLMTVYQNRGRWEPSNVLHREGEILRYDKRNPDPEMEHIDYGLSVFRSSVFDSLPDIFDLELPLKNLIKDRNLAGYEAPNRFYEIGSPVGIAALESHLLQEQSAP